MPARSDASLTLFSKIPVYAWIWKAPRTSPESTSAQHMFRGYIPELDAIRAFGIVMVVLNHMWPMQSYGVWKLLRLAWIAMDSFFVLSGFLIAGILLDSRTRPDYYRTFYIRRALRIFPLYYLVITSVTCVVILSGGPTYTDMLNNWGSPWWFFVYLGNIPSAIADSWPWAGGGSYVVLWSLQVEEQFYLLFPLLVHRLRRETLARVLLGLVCLSPMLRIGIYAWDPGNLHAQYVLLPCRMEGLALGAWLAIRFRQGPWNISKGRLTVLTIIWLGVTCLAAAWSGFDTTRPFNRTFGFLISSVASAHLVLWLILFRGSRVTAWLRLAPVQHLGTISYGIYLLHWPIAAVLAVTSAALGTRLLSEGFSRLAAVCVLSVVCASLSWRFLESPLLSLKDRLSPRTEAQSMKEVEHETCKTLVYAEH